MSKWKRSSFQFLWEMQEWNVCKMGHLFHCVAKNPCAIDAGYCKNHTRVVPTFGGFDCQICTENNLWLYILLISIPCGLFIGWTMSRKPDHQPFISALILKNYLYFMQTVSLFGNTSANKSFMRPFMNFFNLNPSSGSSTGWCLIPEASSYVLSLIVRK